MGTNSSMRHRQLPDYRISERIVVLSGRIQDIAAASTQYRAKTVHTKMDRSANQLRELRLLEIREELRQLLKK